MSFQDSAPLRPFVDKLVARSNLNVVEQDAILALPALLVQIQPTEDFVRLGDEVDHACFVVAGLVGRFSQILNGQRQITVLHVATDMVDLHSVVVPTTTSALQALSVTTILRIPHRALRASANLYTAIAEAFWRECVIDAAVLAQWVVNVGRRSATARIAHLICEIAYRTEAAGATARLCFTFPATQTHIADMVG